MKAVIASALLQTFGIAGSPELAVDIVDYDDAHASAILRMDETSKQKVWVALTFVIKINDEPARILVCSASPHLITLAT